MTDSQPPETFIYLLRHGATEANERRPYVLQGQRMDGPLSETGRDQARRAAEFLAAAEFDRVVASPLRRAVETAEIIAGPHRLPVETLPAIIEVDVGDWEAMTWEAVMDRHPHEYRRFMDRPDVFPYLGGESYADVACRVVPALEGLAEQHPGERIVVVGHNVVNRVYTAHALGVSLATARTLRQTNCGINIIRHRGTETELITLNAVFHLNTLPPRRAKGC